MSKPEDDWKQDEGAHFYSPDAVVRTWVVGVSFDLRADGSVRATWHDFHGEFDFITPKWLTDVIETNFGGEWYIDQQWENHGRDGAVLRRKEETVEKLGVEIDKKAAEAAKRDQTCPKCGQALVNINPPKCENCGTEPFETKDK